MTKFNSEDEPIQQVMREAGDFLLFRLTDDLNKTPFKIRITLFFENASGSHFVEHEAKVDADLYLKSYEDWIRKQAISQAKDIIKGEKKE